MNRETLLLDLLSSDDEALREIYLTSFSVERPSSVLVQRILSLAQEDPSPKVRKAATTVLSRFWPDPRVVALYAALFKDSSIETIVNIVKALGELEDDLSRETLEGLYKEDLDYQLRVSIVVALGRRPFGQVRSFFIRRALNDRDEFIRAMTVTILGRKGDSTMAPVLESCLDDPDPRVRANALEGLSKLTGHVKDILLLRALSDSHHRVQIAALKTLHKQGWNGVSSKVDEMMASPAKLVRSSVEHFLEAINGPRPDQPMVIN